ncbi:hypothetical protein F511_24643 [Dorcoceras hygrometricum]|uniref:Uncharacterized protein n=1 Tax=Dorcoceras hygrometricum TaxID=472368 RepID=A0A2Z7D906_9LAMI|nr:hypothetical protein F511_24643 [Dorcoceras hygrometricum]
MAKIISRSSTVASDVRPTLLGCQATLISTVRGDLINGWETLSHGSWYTYSYTSILRLGLTAGDTPDAPHEHLGTQGPSTPPSTLPTSSKARAIKERAHLGSPGRGLETFSGVTPREAPEHLRHGEELRDRGSNVSSG